MTLEHVKYITIKNWISCLLMASFVLLTFCSILLFQSPVRQLSLSSAPTFPKTLSRQLSAQSCCSTNFTASFATTRKWIKRLWVTREFLECIFYLHCRMRLQSNSWGTGHRLLQENPTAPTNKCDGFPMENPSLTRPKVLRPWASLPVFKSRLDTDFRK